MPLNSSGPISIGGSTSGQSINLELGRAAGAQSSLNETALRTLAGVSSGAISMSSFYGKSNGAVFTPDGGTSSGAPVVLSDAQVGTASVTISCNQTATWNWTRSGSLQATASVATGGSATSITFTLSASVQNRAASFSVNGTAGGITRYYTVTLTADAGLQ